MGDEPSKLEWDLLARKEAIRSEKEKLSEIRGRLDKIEEKLDEIKEDSPSLRKALRTIFSWRNYSTYLATGWTFTAFSYMGLFFNLYLHKELDWEYVLIGGVLSFTSAISAVSRLIGGYVGDVANRKHLSVVAMFMMAVYNLIMGISVEFTWILIALLVLSTLDVFKSGSSAFFMDNVPREHSGLGISLFSAGRVLGIITLGVFIFLTPLLGFGRSLRLMFLSGGLFLIGATIVRAVFLKGEAPDGKREGVSLFRSFIQENKRAASLLLRAVPGMVAVVILDSISDSLFRFGSYIYIYEVIGIGIPGLSLMSIVTIVISVPMLLGTGRMSDRRGERKTALVIYSIMPICALLLMIAPIFPYWAPMSLVNQTESLLTGLGVVFSTPFVAIALKAVNDAVWYLLLLTIIQKNLPRQDTSKILGVFWFFVFLFASVGPSVGGFVFQFFYQGHLFMVVLILNLIILGWIATKGLVKSTKETEIVNDGG